MTKLEIESAILAIVRDPEYRPVKPRDRPAAAAAAAQVADVRKAVKRLVKRGELVYGSNHLVQAAGAVAKPKRANRVVGVFRRNAKGYGFVRPAGQSPGQGLAMDIYIPAEKTGDASDGDVVSVRLETGGSRRFRAAGRSRRGRPARDASLCGLVFRGPRRVVRRGGCRGSIRFPLAIPARDVQPNDKVVVEMVRFPSQVHPGEAVIVEVLGPRGVPGVDTLTILREYDLPEAFSEEVLGKNCADRAIASMSRSPPAGST